MKPQTKLYKYIASYLLLEEKIRLLLSAKPKFTAFCKCSHPSVFQFPAQRKTGVMEIEHRCLVCGGEII